MASTYEIEIVGLRGTRRRLLISAAPLLDSTGRLSSVVGTMMDLTERERAEEARRKTEERFRSLVQNASDLITVIDRDGKLIYASPSCEGIMGYAPAELQGRELMTLLHPDDIEMAATSLANVIRVPGVHPSVELRVRHKDGSCRWVETVAQSLLDDPAVGGIVHNSRDITDRKVIEGALRESEERYRSLAENTFDLIYEIGPDGRFSYLSPNFPETLGYELDELNGTSALDLIHPDDRQRVGEEIVRALSSGSSGATFRYRHKNGGWLWMDSTAKLIPSRPEEPRLVIVSREVTQRVEAEEALRRSEERFRALVQNASDLITVIGADTCLLYQSPAIERMLGYTVTEVVGKKLVDLIHSDDVPKLLAYCGRLMGRAGDMAALELRIKSKDGAWHHLEITGGDVRDDPAVAGLVLNSRDITERKLLEEQLRHQAFHDSLTGLANRTRFVDRVEHAVARNLRSTRLVAVLAIDLDDFKAVNDRLGHIGGDQVLREAGARLLACLRGGDTAARLGGDEFAVLLEDVIDVESAQATVARILEALRQPLAIDGQEIFLRASVGVAVAGGEGLRKTGGDGLMRNADVAMYVAKRGGKGRCQLYDPSMHTSLLDRLTLLGDLQRAVERDEFVVHYQPMVLLSTSEIVGVEALVRWRHPERGLLPPDEFISLAEESGVIVDLGRHVLNEACRQAKRWQLLYPSQPPLTMSVNISVRQIQQPGMVEEVARALQDAGLDGSTLILEITESVMMHDREATVPLLHELKLLGIRLAVDDFGTGYSSLGYLSQFPFDILKIDKSFIDSDRVSERELTSAIVELGKRLQLEIVAEGIERIEQLTRLRSLGCDIGQGFYFARPVAAEEIDDLLQSDRSRRATA